MICDFHMHTEFSGDSEAPVRDQVERAIALGMPEICVTDHHDYDSGFCEMCIRDRRSSAHTPF